MKRYIVERTNKAELRPEEQIDKAEIRREEQSEKAESCPKNLWNVN